MAVGRVCGEPLSVQIPVNRGIYREFCDFCLKSLSAKPTMWLNPLKFLRRHLDFGKVHNRELSLEYQGILIP